MPSLDHVQSYVRGMSASIVNVGSLVLLNTNGSINVMKKMNLR